MPPSRGRANARRPLRVAIVKKRLGLPASLYEMLQIFSVTLFEKTPINSLFDADQSKNSPVADPN
jgi:hypothetical protein